MLCEDGETRYIWEPIDLTTIELNVIGMDPGELATDERWLQRSGLSKEAYNDIIIRVRLAFDALCEAEYPIPHTVNVRWRNALMPAIARVIAEADLRTGLPTIYFEDYPLFERYFELCFEKDRILDSIHAYQRTHQNAVKKLAKAEAQKQKGKKGAKT